MKCSFTFSARAMKAKEGLAFTLPEVVVMVVGDEYVIRDGEKTVTLVVTKRSLVSQSPGPMYWQLHLDVPATRH